MTESRCVEAMRKRDRNLTTALLAALGVCTALVAPALACGIGTACPMSAAPSHCAIAGASATCGGASMTSAPPLCCTSQAKAPTATLRDAAPTRIDWTSALIAVTTSAADAVAPARLQFDGGPRALSPPPRDTLSLNSTLLL